MHGLESLIDTDTYVAQVKPYVGSYLVVAAAGGVDTAAGIAVPIPANEVAFARYDPPFARFDSAGDLGARVLLISQPGDQATLFGLYDIMQTLRIVPLEGERERSSNRFTLTG